MSRTSAYYQNCLTIISVALYVPIAIFLLCYYTVLTKQLQERRFHIAMLVLNLFACAFQITSQCIYSLYYDHNEDRFVHWANFFYSLYFACLTLVLTIFTLKYVGLAERVHAMVRGCNLPSGFEMRVKIILVVMVSIILLQIAFANWVLWDAAETRKAVSVLFSLF